MLLALIFTAYVICLIFGEWPGPSRFTTPAEAEALERKMRETEARKYKERKQGLKTVGANGEKESMMEDEVEYFLTLANNEYGRAREGWLKSLSLRHERGELTDSEFSEEINKCLDETAVKTMK